MPRDFEGVWRIGAVETPWRIARACDRSPTTDSCTPVSMLMVQVGPRGKSGSGAESPLHPVDREAAPRQSKIPPLPALGSVGCKWDEQRQRRAAATDVVQAPSALGKASQARCHERPESLAQGGDIRGTAQAVGQHVESARFCE